MTQPLTVVLAVYRRADQVRYLPALFESLIRNGHTRIVLATYDEGAAEAEVTRLCTRPDVHVTRAVLDRKSDADLAASLDADVPDYLLSLMAWTRGVQLIGTGDPFVALDIASLVLRPLDEVVPKIQPRLYTLALAQGLGSTGRPCWLPGVLYGVGGALAVWTMNSVWRETLKILGRGDRVGMEKTYGSALSAALMLAKSKADEGGGAIFGVLPKGWITSDERPSAEAGIVRFVDGAK